MKLKELPSSLWSSVQLWKQSPEQLIKHADSRAKGVIVSLTSIESRLAIIHITIRSLLRQSTQPDFIVLWLKNDLEHKVPARLQALCGKHFQIRYSDEGCAHRKLVESLRHFPEKHIVTCDDDVIYAHDWLERLWQEHQRFPHAIIAHECRRIASDSSGATLEYKHWHSEEQGLSHPNTLAIGYGGVFYPAETMPAHTCEHELYMQLAPRADDLWFKAISHSAGIKTRRSSQPNPKPIPIAFSQAVSLKHNNVRQDGNLLQWQALAQHFQITFSPKPHSASEKRREN